MWRVNIEYRSPPRIVSERRNTHVILHELAHAINWYQFVSWGSADPDDPHRHDHASTGSHGLTYRCLAIDPYDKYGMPDRPDWWAAVYDELHRLCLLAVPDYARPALD